VTVRDVTTVVQRLEMVSRISAEIDGYVVELGADGRLLSLQLDELIGGLAPDREYIIRDYSARPAESVAGVLARLAALSSAELIEMSAIARALGIGGPDGQSLDDALSPRGYRMLSRIPRLPSPVVSALVEHLGPLQKLLAASTEDLQQVDGVGPQRARSVREGLSRLAESSILERYVGAVGVSAEGEDLVLAERRAVERDGEAVGARAGLRLLVGAALRGAVTVPAHGDGRRRAGVEQELLGRVTRAVRRGPHGVAPGLDLGD